MPRTSQRQVPSCDLRAAGYASGRVYGSRSDFHHAHIMTRSQFVTAVPGVASVDEYAQRPNRRTFLPFHLPRITEDEIRAVVETLRSGWLTSGPQVHRFEEAFAEGRQSRMRSQ